MAGHRRYRLLCPIARALDRVGDRWALLLLRDLHAGPARFTDLQAGLPGLATNLLTTRLRQLEEDGLIRRREAGFGVTVYELTGLGERTRELLFELAAFGAQFPADDEVRRPGNLRTIAVTLEVACQRVVEPEVELIAELNVDGERFTLGARAGQVRVRSGPPEEPGVVMATSYEPLIAVADGDLALDTFAAEHVTLEERVPGQQAVLLGLMGRAVSTIVGETS